MVKSLFQSESSVSCPSLCLFLPVVRTVRVGEEKVRQSMPQEESVIFPGIAWICLFVWSFFFWRSLRAVSQQRAERGQLKASEWKHSNRAMTRRELLPMNLPKIRTEGFYWKSKKKKWKQMIMSLGLEACGVFINVMSMNIMSGNGELWFLEMHALYNFHLFYLSILNHASTYKSWIHHQVIKH